MGVSPGYRACRFVVRAHLRCLRSHLPDGVPFLRLRLPFTVAVARGHACLPPLPLPAVLGTAIALPHACWDFCLSAAAMGSAVLPLLRFTPPACTVFCSAVTFCWNTSYSRYSPP